MSVTKWSDCISPKPEPYLFPLPHPATILISPIEHQMANNLKENIIILLPDKAQDSNSEGKGGIFTWLQRSQVKGRKSICLQSSTMQCFPRSGNSGVPINAQLTDRRRNRKQQENRRILSFTTIKGWLWPENFEAGIFGIESNLRGWIILEADSQLPREIRKKTRRILPGNPPISRRKSSRSPPLPTNQSCCLSPQELGPVLSGNFLLRP